MKIELGYGEIETLLTNLEYAKQRITDATDTPSEVRRENLGRVVKVTEKLRAYRREHDA